MELYLIRENTGSTFDYNVFILYNKFPKGENDLFLSVSEVTVGSGYPRFVLLRGTSPVPVFRTRTVDDKSSGVSQLEIVNIHRANMGNI